MNRGGANVIEFVNVSKFFEQSFETVQALREVSCVIPKSSFTIVFGPSGSGKSTLFNVMAGLEPPTTGRVLYEGNNIYALDSDQRANFRSRTIGMVYQSNYWINSLSVIENVALPLMLTGYTKKQAELFAQESLDLIGMSQYGRYKPFVLSGGQQQRISMARALAPNPLVLMADEPTGNLDTKNGLMLIKILQDLQQKYKKTVIMITHNTEYLQYSNHRLIIQDGILEQETGAFNPKTSIINKKQKQNLTN